MLWWVPRSKILLQASLRRTSDLLTLISYNAGKIRKKRRGNTPRPLTLHIDYCTIIRKSSTGPDTERSVRGDKTWTKLRKKPGGVKFIKI